MRKLAILLLVVYAVIGLTARPEADDYCVAGLVGATGIVHGDALSYTVDMYNGFFGRYTQTFVQAALSQADPLYTMLMPGFMVIAFALLFTLILRTYHVPDAALIAIAFTAAWLSALPGIEDTLDWQTAAMTYLLPVLIALFTLALVRRGHSALWCFPLALIAGGCSEPVTVMLAFGAGVLALIDRRLRLPALLWGIGLAIAFMVVVSAPGNAVRATFFPAPSFSNAKWDTVTWLTGDYVVTLFRTLPGLVLAYFVGRLYPVQVSRLTVLLAWSACILVTMGTLFMVSYATGTSYHPDRVLALVSLTTCGALYVTGSMGKRKRAGTRWIVFLVLIVAIVFNAVKLPERLVYAARYDARAAQLSSGARMVKSLGQLDSLRPPFTPGNVWVLNCAKAWVGHEFTVEG